MSEQSAQQEAGEWEQDDCGEDADCLDCGGEGWVFGDEIASRYDAGWIDPEEAYTCRNCGGSGKARDMTVW